MTIEVSEGTNRLEQALSDAFGGAGEISMLPLAEEVEDQLGDPTEEDVMVNEVLSNVAREQGDDYDEYSEPVGDDSCDVDMQLIRGESAGDIPADFDFDQLEPDEQAVLEQLGMGLMSGEITEDDLYDLLD